MTLENILIIALMYITYSQMASSRRLWHGDVY